MRGLRRTGSIKMLDKLKTYGIPAAAILACLGCFFYGAHVERLKADKKIAELEETYAQQERDALRKAEELRQEQEAKFVAEMERLRRESADIATDAGRVRKQFDELKKRRSATLEQCNRRASRCEQLLSEAYELAGECEGLLRDRDARLKSLKRH